MITDIKVKGYKLGTVSELMSEKHVNLGEVVTTDPKENNK